MGDLNAHHTEWLNFVTPTDCAGRSVLDFADMSGCVQLVKESTHNNGNCLDLLFTDVQGMVEVSVDPPIGTSDHSIVSFQLDTNFKVPDIQFSRRIYLKSQADWRGVLADLDHIHWN